MNDDNLSSIETMENLLFFRILDFNKNLIKFNQESDQIFLIYEFFIHELFNHTI